MKPESQSAAAADNDVTNRITVLELQVERLAAAQRLALNVIDELVDELEELSRKVG